MQHSLGSKRLGRMGGSGWRAFIIGRDPGGDGCGDGAVVSPTNDKVVVVWGGRIGGGGVGRADRWTTGFVVRGGCGGLSGGFSSGRELQNPGLGSQAEVEGLFSRQTLVM